MPSRLLARAVALAACSLLALPAAGHAASIAVSDGTLHVTSAVGEANSLTVTAGGGSLTVNESAAGLRLVAGPGCVPATVVRVTCSLSGVSRIEAVGGDGADTIAISASLPARLDGGAGNDVLTGGGAADVLVPGPGADALAGGGGADAADYGERVAAVVVDLDRTDAVAGEAGEGDRVAGDIEAAIGGAGDDRLSGDGGANTLTGGAGHDTLDGRLGADRLEGGDGIDTVDYSTRRSTVYADIDGGADDGQSGERDDVRPDVERLVGGSSGDRLTGAAGDQALVGNDGNDVLDGAGGSDRLDGGDGADTLRGADGDDALSGGAGADTLEAAAGDDEVFGGDGADKLHGGDGADRLDAGLHDDEVRAGRGDDDLRGAEGDDRLYGEDDADSLDAGEGHDQAWGGRGDDSVAGSAGDDRAYGDDGNDRLDGGDGGDHLDGGGHDDGLAGGPGRDTLRGAAGNDRLAGGADGDDLDASSGDDRLDGEDGDDKLEAGSGNDVADAGAGTDDVDGGDGNDELHGGDGADHVHGAGDDDALLGGPGDDELEGDDGVDRIDDGDGADRVSGGPGDDMLVAGAGADSLAGDAGQDAVDYSARVAPLTVTNDDRPGDGEAGEGDDVRSTVDDIIGGQAGDRLVGSDWHNKISGEAGDDRLEGGAEADELLGGAGKDIVIGGPGKDLLDGGDDADHLSAHDGVAETVRCGAGADVAIVDRADTAERCEKRRNKSGSIAGAPSNSVPVPTTRAPSGLAGVRKVTSRGRFVAIPGSPGERIDSRILGDVLYLKRKYKVAITDGLALTGHSRHGEHPIGLALDIVPGPGVSWADVDRLARWAEPRRNRPRSPFRWVGYNGDPGHGRGHHLHLSWRHGAARRGRPARWVMRLDFRRRPSVRVRSLVHLAGRHNGSIGGAPSYRSGLRAATRCRGASAELQATWKAAGRAFGIRWSVLAAITEIESAHGCNLGPSSAGAIGWTQFMPSTWKHWGMDASGDGRARPSNSVDAIFSSARYLRATGAPRSYRKALWAYNHATWYVNDVLRRARKYR